MPAPSAPPPSGGPGGGRWRRGWTASAVLLAAVAAPALPTWAALALLAAVAALWTALRPPRRELVAVGLGLLAAAGALAYGRHAGTAPDLADADWRAATRRGYAAVWSSLESEAARLQGVLVARGLDGAVGGGEDRLRAFRTLGELAAAQGEGRHALLLVDPDGEPVAWAGEGLLHELRPEEIPRQGRAFEASFGAVTTFAVAPLEEDVRRPWRVVAARSFSTDHLPFAPGALDPLLLDPAARALRWSLVDDPAQAAAGASLLKVDGAPDLVMEPAALPAAAVSPAGRLAWAVLALALLTLAAIRGTGRALAAAAPEPPGDKPLPAADRGGAVAVALLAVGGAVSAGLAAGAAAVAVASLAAALVLAAAGFGLAERLPRPGGRRGRWLPVLGGAAAALLLAAAAVAAQVAVGPLAASSQLLTTPTVLALRLALVALAVSLLVLAAGTPRQRGDGPADAAADDRGERWAWISLPLLLAGAAFCDQPALALPLLAFGAGAVARWLGERRQRSAAGLAVLLLLAALLAAGVWETAERRLLRSELAQHTLPRVGLPAAADMAREAARVGDFFRASDLTRFVPRSPDGLGREDLAYLLWRASPLARPNALSRLTVRPLQGPASSFSFGVPVNDLGQVDPEGWADALPVPAADRLVEGSARLAYRGEPWAVVEWSLLPLPGFLLPASESLEDVEATLLRGLPDVSGVAGLPAEVTFVTYDGAARPYASPWPQEPPLADALAGDGPRRAVVPTPQGDAWAVSRPAGDGWEVLYLPRLAPPQALERVGTHVLGVLLALLTLALLALLAALPRHAFRDGLRRAVRSYSKRLLLVYTLLLLVPLLLLNGVLVAAMQDRLRQEQRAAGEAALASAQRVLGTYLASLDPGFDLASELDDDLLRWLSQVVRHEINLYWGSEIWASSKPELFAARLLPKRIPGESFAGIAFRGFDLAARTNRVGNVSYLELYAPLPVPGGEVAPRNFFLSMPLLAQQEEVARELATLRRQALLVTAVLIILVSAVGVRLSRSFTRPLTELVEGTRRIAAGATSLDLSPSELELAALVEAVDEMARRIADGRERLLREKQVVERMVEHITSGVVSLDGDRRVLMRNRVAAQLLGVEVGERLDLALARRPRLAPLAGWLQTVGQRLSQRTVRLPASEGEPEDAIGRGGPTALAGVSGGTGAWASAAASGGANAGASDEAGGEREWTLVWVPVPGSGEPSALLVVEDATETLRGQRLEAWAEMARIIAHEIKNPLTPIRLNIEHVQQVWRDHADDERFGAALERCTSNVLAQVDELRQIASEFSTYSHIPKIEPRPGDLVAAVHDLAEPYRAAPPPGVTVVVESEMTTLEARFDPRLFTRAVRNLVENALRASAGGGRVMLRLERRPVDGGGAEACIRVLDSGPGIAPALLPRIFDPYFSTHDSGTGLGLPIARRIAEEHGGTISARNRPQGGLEVTITLPLR